MGRSLGRPVAGLNLASGCELSFSEKGWQENGSRVRYLVWEKGYTSKVRDGNAARPHLYLGKLWCSISEFTASEKTPPLSSVSLSLALALPFQ